MICLRACVGAAKLVGLEDTIPGNVLQLKTNNLKRV